MQLSELKKAREGKPLKDLSDVDNLKLKAKLSALCIFLGITKPPDELAMTMILMFLKKEFSSYHVGEIELAASLYASGKLPELKDHYGSMNAKFLGDMLNAYRFVRHEATKYEGSYIDESLQITENKKSQNEINQEYFTGLLDLMETLDRLPEIYPYENCYDYLFSLGVIQPSPSEKTDHAKYVKEIIERENSGQVDSYIVRERIRVLLEKTTFANRCKMEYFKFWVMDQVLDNGGSIQEFIKAQKQLKQAM